jgi:hypothetical protein
MDLLDASLAGYLPNLRSLKLGHNNLYRFPLLCCLLDQLEGQRTAIHSFQHKLSLANPCVRRAMAGHERHQEDPPSGSRHDEPTAAFPRPKQNRFRGSGPSLL